VVTSEHRRDSVLTGEGPDDPFTDLHIAIKRRRMTGRNCDRRRQERGSVRNMAI